MKTISVEVPENVYALGEALKGMVAAVDQAVSDGWQPGVDIPVIITAAFQNLVPAIQSVKGASDEVKSAPFESAKALELAVTDIVKTLVT